MLKLLSQCVILLSTLLWQVTTPKRTYHGKTFHYFNNPSFRGRIVGGVQAPPHAFPWQALIQRSFPSLVTCGGSLIQLNKSKNESDLILTAAHCMYDKQRHLWIDSKNVTVILGAHNRLNPYEESRKVHFVRGYLAHFYQPSATDNDIAVLKLSSPAAHSPTIGPVCVPENKDVVKPGTACLTIGWGATDSWDSLGALRMVSLTITTPEACNWTPLRHPQEICAHDFSGGGICNGDSGSPLLCEQGGRYFVFGIASWVTNCGEVSAFVNVSHYSDWIRGAAWWLDEWLVKAEPTNT
ncbi:Serine protease [Trichuris trichiura]|uniref:Serine protease n=1 Tax=Trichuris trichiura TaxID=36087 RepID=A0A077ZDA7_TRITR|nr:Serine protease [Trichuris trichiura]